MVAHSCLQALTTTSNPVAGERVPQRSCLRAGFHSRECQAYLCQLLATGHHRWLWMALGFFAELTLALGRSIH